MKNLIILLVFVVVGMGLFSSCAMVEEQVVEAPSIKAVTKSAPSMTKEEIANEFIMLSEAKEMEDRLSPEAVKRLETLQPDEAFITKEQIEELHKSATEHARNKAFQQKSGEPRGVDRRHCDTPVVNQCGGTCTSHGISSAMDNLFCNPKVFNAANQDLWSKYEKYSSWTGIKAAASNKICEEKDFPNCGKKKSTCRGNSHIKLKSYAYMGNDIEAIKAELDKGFPQNLSGKVTNSWANCDKVMNPKSSSKGGGHAVTAVGYQEVPGILGGGYFIIKNSWGTRCGDNGYQYLPFYYLQRTDNGMYGYTHSIRAIETKYDDPSVKPEPVEPTPNKPVVCKKVRTCKRKFMWCWKWNPWKTVCN